MTTEDFITELFSRVDDTMSDVANHSQASLHPSEVVTIGLLYAIGGGHQGLLPLAVPKPLAHVP